MVKSGGKWLKMGNSYNMNMNYTKNIVDESNIIIMGVCD